jgi:hypothetical protein
MPRKKIPLDLLDWTAPPPSDAPSRPPMPNAPNAPVGSSGARLRFGAGADGGPEGRAERGERAESGAPSSGYGASVRELTTAINRRNASAMRPGHKAKAANRADISRVLARMFGEDESGPDR